MKIRVKLYARLERYLPEADAGRASRNEADLEVADGVTPADVFNRLGLPTEYCHLVLVNGVFVAPGERGARRLEDGDHLAVWPPVAGGGDTKGSAGGGDTKGSAGGGDTKESAGGVGSKGSAGGARDVEEPASGGRTVIEKEMALTHADFFRTLPRALGTAKFRKSATGAVLADGKKRLAILLGPEGKRRIAGLTIPATRVTLTFEGYAETEADAALRRFDRSFQKGGG
ncbi:MAG: MoaD/ThiS family protein [Rhodospirillales bacterium]